MSLLPYIQRFFLLFGRNTTTPAQAAPKPTSHTGYFEVKNARNVVGLGKDAQSLPPETSPFVKETAQV
jgi:hypothetical protein